MATEEDVRRIALSLPETFEKASYGTPGFRVKHRATTGSTQRPGSTETA